MFLLGTPRLDPESIFAKCALQDVILDLANAYFGMYTKLRSWAGSSELRNGQNCVVLPSLAEFAEEIASLASDPERRERLGRAAKATFEKHFTLEAQLPAFKRVLSCAFPMR